MKKLAISFCLLSLFGMIQAQMIAPEDELRGMVKMNTEIKDHAQLENIFTQLIENHPEKPQGYTNLGGVKFHMEKYDAAIEQFNKAIAISPDPGLIYNRGLAKIKLLDFDGAIEDFKQVISFLPHDHEARFNMAYAYYKAGKKEDAVATLDNIIKTKPGYVEALNNRGYIKYESGKFDEAVNDFNVAIQSADKDHRLFYNRGLVFLKTGDNSKACKDIRTASDFGNAAANDLAKEICK